MPRSVQGSGYLVRVSLRERTHVGVGASLAQALGDPLGDLRVRRRGRLDVRRTLRRSLSAGGVPLDPTFRHPHASKPELYLLCDISGSVSEFARFSMSLLYAMKAEFSRIRLFAFVDGIDEVTGRMEDGGHELAPRNLLYGTKVIVGDGHSATATRSRASGIGTGSRTSIPVRR